MRHSAIKSNCQPFCMIFFRSVKMYVARTLAASGRGAKLCAYETQKGSKDTPLRP